MATRAVLSQQVPTIPWPTTSGWVGGWEKGQTQINLFFSFPFSPFFPPRKKEGEKKTRRGGKEKRKSLVKREGGRRHRQAKRRGKQCLNRLLFSSPLYPLTHTAQCIFFHPRSGGRADRINDALARNGPFSSSSSYPLSYSLARHSITGGRGGGGPSSRSLNGKELVLLLPLTSRGFVAVYNSI